MTARDVDEEAGDGAAVVLADLISGVSQDAWGVRWKYGAEYRVWRLIVRPRSRWGRVTSDSVRPALVTAQLLARQAGIWLVRPGRHAPPVPIPLAAWQARYERWAHALLTTDRNRTRKRSSR